MTALNAERRAKSRGLTSMRLAHEYNLEDYSKTQYYLWSLYWALTTLTTVGYGDIAPASDSERLYASFSVLVGGMIFDTMISQGTLIASLDRQAALIEEKLDSVKEYASSRKLPQSALRQVDEALQVLLLPGSPSSTRTSSSTVPTGTPRRSDAVHSQLHSASCPSQNASTPRSRRSCSTHQADLVRSRRRHLRKG